MNQYTGNILFYLNYNDMLMRFQINQYYKLGRESSNFVNYINSNKDESFVFKDGKNKNYFDKFFVEDIYEVKFEDGDRIVDYLKNPLSGKNHHQEILKEIKAKIDH
jgi:hypothetical protein